MALQYQCKDERRRERVREHDWLNGIDYLEVVDADEPIDELKQRTLLVWCLKPIEDITSENVRIEGGVRVTNIAIEWAAPATEVGDRFDTGDLAEDDAQRLLVVRTAARGDFSTYRLSLVASSASSQPPENFDEMLAHVDFSFKVECPSEFDCKADSVCPDEVSDEPVIDYLAKDYTSFRQIMLDRLAVIAPNWQERSPADIGIALVETLAYAGDQLSYFQDAASTEAYLGTARRRVSLRRHARMLDYKMHEGCNARAWVQFTAETVDGGGGEGAIIPADAQLLAGIPGAALLDESQVEDSVSVHHPEMFKLMHEIALYPAHNEMLFYLWGDDECCLPVGATKATLQDKVDTPLHLSPGDVLIFEEVKGPANGISSDADPSHRHPVRLTAVTASVDELTEQPIVRIEWASEDALPFPLCISTIVEGEVYRDVSVALGNIALADHGETILDEELSPPPSSTSRFFYRPTLEESGLTHRVFDDDGPSQTGAAYAALVQDPQEAVPDIFLDNDGECWWPRSDLLESARFDTDFVVEMESDGRAILRFARADDDQAKTPGSDANLRATYRVGNGIAGNVGAEAISSIVRPEDADPASAYHSLEITGVRNPLSASGGIDPESGEVIRLNAPQAFRVQQRAVTEADYAEMAQRHSEVQRAVATRRWTGSWHTMFITVDRLGGREVDADFEDDLREFLGQYRLAGHDMEVEPPLFVPLELAMTVCVCPDHFASDVNEALLTAFSAHELPSGNRGFFHPDNFSFGQPLYLSKVIAAAMEVPGVLWVDLRDSGDEVNLFRRWGEPSHGEYDGGQITMGRLEIARLDNDPNFPENGRMSFTMQGGA